MEILQYIWRKLADSRKMWYTFAMKITTIPLQAALCALVILFASCATTGGAGQSASVLSPEAQKLVKEAVFEVLVKQPVRDAITYEKKPDLELIPYAIRSDAYYSIGTAFAVSSTELVTAFHVIDLGEESLVFNEYFIRDSSGKVFEVDSVVKGSNEKDFLVFTARGRTFSSYFALERNVREGVQVFSIGNALGEGIIVRSGLVLGTVPERESGRWNQLKSSSDSSPGNSGGPLITHDGKVVSIITARNDNILYSLPVSVMLESPAKIDFRQKLTYGHLLLANTMPAVYETQVSLPKPYKDARKEITADYKKIYPQHMTELFAEAPEYLTGPQNMYLLNQVAGSFPEVAFVDKNDSQWKLSDLKVNNSNLPDEGRLSVASVSEFHLIKVQKPKTSAIAPLISNPKALMDLMLKGIVIERTIGNTGKYRILSYGEPAEVSSFTDKIGRTWVKAFWLADYDDSVVIAYILPLPNGPFVIMTIQPSARLAIYQWDAEAICDLVQAAYVGEFTEWKEFLDSKPRLPPVLKDLAFSFDEPAKRVSVSVSDFSVIANQDVFSWLPSSSLLISPAYYSLNGKVQYGIRRFILQRDKRGRDYALLNKDIEPDSRLGARSAEAWQDVIDEKYPFDNVAHISEKDNTGSIGAVLSRPASNNCWWLYYAAENPASTAALSAHFNALKNGILFK
jgi:hypothetical protein